jgi:hypothetical protein
VVLYESAKNIHGRPFPLNGRSYDNLFSHFRPTTWGNGARPVLRPEYDSEEEEDEEEYYSEDEEGVYDSEDEYDFDGEEEEDEEEDWTVHEGWIEEEGSAFMEEM